MDPPNQERPIAKTWFITGASRGFGALIAEQALERRDRVVATARSPDTVAKTLGDRPNLLAVGLDVTDAEQAVAAAQAAVGRFGSIDVLVNNAGFGLLGAVEEATAAEVEQVYATNVFGLLAVTRAVLPHMRRQRSGHIINMSSIGGYAASAGWGVYGSTKFAVEGITEALALELKPLGIMRPSWNRDSSGPTSWTPAPCRSARRRSRTTRTPWAPCGVSPPAPTTRSPVTPPSSRRR